MDSLPNGKMPVVKETAKLALGELAVSALTVGVYLLIGKFTPGVIVGVLAGTLVILLNFFLLAYSVNRTGILPSSHPASDCGPRRLLFTPLRRRNRVSRPFARRAPSVIADRAALLSEGTKIR